MPTLTLLGFALAVVGGTLAIAGPLADVYVLPKLLALGVGGTLAWLGLLRAKLRPTALDRPLAALWAVMLAATAFSVDRPLSILGVYPQAFYGLLPLGLCTALYYAVASSETSEDTLISLCLAGAIALSAYGLMQKAFGDPFIPFELPTGRITSLIGNPTMLGACLALLLPLALHSALQQKSAAGRAALALLPPALVLTWSRGAWIGAATSALAYLWMTGRARPKTSRAWGLALSVSVVAAVLILATRRGASDSMRLELWISSALAFIERPLFGYGPDTFVHAFRPNKTDGFLRAAARTDVFQFSAHNDLIQVAVTLGLAGLAAYFWLLWALASSLHRRLSAAAKGSSNGRAAALGAALFGLFVLAKAGVVPLTGLALAAVLAGLASRESSRPPLKPAASRALCLFAAVFCAACAGLHGRLIAADYSFRRGTLYLDKAAVTDPHFTEGVNFLRRATELNPWTMDYLSQRCQMIYRLAELAPPETAKKFLEKSVALTREAVRLHPHDSLAHELLGTSLMLLAKYGSATLAEALAETNAASDLDPNSSFLLRRRMDLARELRDRPEFDRALAEYRRVAALTGEKMVLGRAF